MLSHKASTFFGGILILAITLFGGLVHGSYSNRWHQADGMLDAAGEILGQFPTEFGDWYCSREIAFDRYEPAILRFSGAINRVYVNRLSGDTVSVAAIVGPPGRTSTHTAPLCFRTSGYRIVGEPQRVDVSVGELDHQFARCYFSAESAVEPSIEVWYSWRQSSDWQVPVIPRVHFGAGELLFKVQLVSEIDEIADASKEPSCKLFLDQFLPAMEEFTFAPLLALSRSRPADVRDSTGGDFVNLVVDFAQWLQGEKPE